MKSAMELADEAFEAVRIGNNRGKALALGALGVSFDAGDPGAADRALAALGQAAVAEGRFGEAITLVDAGFRRLTARFGPRPRSSRLCAVLGAACRMLGLYDQALVHLLEAKTLAAEAGDQPALGGVLVNLGDLYADIEDWDRAPEYFLAALALYESLGDPYRATQARLNLALVYGASGRPDEAVSQFDSVVQEARASGDLVTLALALDGRGSFLLKLEQVDEALANLQGAADLAGHLHEYHRFQTLVHLAEARLAAHEADLATAELAKVRCDSGNPLPRSLAASVCLVRAEVAESLGRYQEAAGLYREYLTRHRDQGRSRGALVSKDAGLQAQRVLAVDLELGMARRTDILLRSQDAMIGALAVLAETRDGDTGAHVSRTSRITALLCQELQNAGMPGMDEDRVFFYGATSALHDIGKVGVPDAVLLKEGPLDPSELKAMRRHVEIGESVVNSISFGPGESPYFQCALEIIGGHHERWDGRGYPRGLAGPEIPLGGRIVAVADVYDAIRSKRPYKGEKSHEEAVEYIRDNGGRHFDPLVSQAFLRIAGQVAQVYSEPETGG